jgi:hypothetical protein
VSTGAEDKDVLQGREPFLDRWSRRKAEAGREAPPATREQDAAAKAPPPDLPPVEKLTFDSDYRAFFHPKVSEDARRAALKKLFSDPRFNVMDGLDVYIDDYSKSEPIPPAMLAGLRQAQKILEWAKGGDPEKKEADAEQQATPASPVALDEGESPPVPGPATAGAIAGDSIPAGSKSPRRGRKRS